MKKATIILILFIQVVLFFIFISLNAWFMEFGETDLTNIKNPHSLTANIQKMKKMFSVLTIVSGVFMLATVFYLAIQFKKPRGPSPAENIPPLQNYLLQLKGSENQLKDLVQKQQVNVIEKEELNKSIINHIDAAVIFLNHSKRIDIFNTVAQQLFSQSYGNAKNNLLEVVLAKFPAILEEVKQHNGSKYSGEVQCIDPVTRLNRVFFLHHNPMENIGQLLIIRDITQEKRKEEFDRRNNNFIMLGEMAAFLAHEVRNSLGVIYGYTKTIKSEKELEKTAKVNKEINFLTAMMESFLNFSKPVKVISRENIQLKKLFESIAAETGITLKCEQEEEVSLKTDPTFIRSIVSNLMINASESGADTIEVSFQQAGEEPLEITVTDNGNGIEPENREKIWFPFFTTKAKGTGMGLAIIRKMITSLNGEIKLVETEAPGVRADSPGATFRLTFYG